MNGASIDWTATGGAPNTIGYHGDLVVGLMPVPYGGTQWGAPNDGSWGSSLDWKYKVAKMAHGMYIGNGGAPPTPSYTSLTYSPKSNVKLKATYRPWRIERVKRSNYMIDDDYETALASSAGSSSTVTRKHEIDLFWFNPWFLNQTSIPYQQARIKVTIKVWGYFYQPKQVEL